MVLDQIRGLSSPLIGAQNGMGTADLTTTTATGRTMGAMGNPALWRGTRRDMSLR